MVVKTTKMGRISVRELRLEIITEDKKFQNIVILTEGTYADEHIQEMEVLEAFRDLRRTVNEETGTQ
jgi:hypothetical protein